MRTEPPENVESNLEHILDAVPTTVHLINPSETVLSTFITHAYTRETLPTTRIFAPLDTFQSVFDDFKTASKAAELASSHEIAFRTAKFNAPPTIVYDNTVLSIIEHYLLEDTNQQLASDIHELVSENWDATTEYTFTTPPLNAIYESITNTFSSDVLLDVKAFIDAADSTPLSPPLLALLIAIRHNYNLAEITNWAESLDLTTRGTLSRYRQQLENSGEITTTPIETDTPGRPPLTINAINDSLTEDATTALTTLSTALDDTKT